jgi:hypothetical protein
MDPSKAVGRPALALAGFGALLMVLLATRTFGRGSVFCGSTSCFVEAVVWSLPTYAAVLAIVLSAVLIAAAVVRARVGPPVLRIVGLGVAIASAAVYVVVSLVSLDVAWVGAFSGRLTPAPPTPLLPPIPATLMPLLWALSFVLIGVWIALTSLLTLSLRTPPALVIFGWLAGVGFLGFIPVAAYARDYTVSTYALPVVVLAMTAWALILGITLIKRAPPTA